MKKLFQTTYFKWGATLFGAGVCLITFFMILQHFDGFRAGLATARSVLAPFIFGFVIAYLLNPLYTWVVRQLYRLIAPNFKKPKRALTLSKVIATIACVLLLVGIIGGMIAMMIPQLIDSITGVLATLPDRVDQFSAWLDDKANLIEDPVMQARIEEMMHRFESTLEDMVEEKLLPGVGSLLEKLSNQLLVTLTTLFHFLLGIIASVYFLNGKERFQAQARMIIRAVFNEEQTKEVLEFWAFTNKTFGGFISGKIIDSVIIGILCFLMMTVFKMPYPLLISVIIGATNVIPFFGPFIGAIPSILIIFLESPLQALYFLILVVILQQLDGNVIGPSILGNTTGLQSFWVMFAIIVGGGFFGFVGMVVGVPVFAVIYYYGGRLIRRRLKHRHLPEETKEYMTFDKYNIDRKDILE